MFHLSYFLVCFLLLTTVISTPLKRGVPEILADLEIFSKEVDKLATDVHAFPNTGGTLVAALIIHNDLVTMTATVNQATTDARSTGSISEVDGIAILNLLEDILRRLLDVLLELERKAPIFRALPLGGIPALLLQDLKTLQTAIIAFFNAIIADLPSDLESQAQTDTNTINTELNNVIAAYSA
ncbi:hydrophobic surface binding protein [Mycena rebaudengoi]|nr:hydrophobic surface binding protein [Mycena rebaudengoi]